MVILGGRAGGEIEVLVEGVDGDLRRGDSRLVEEGVGDKKGVYSGGVGSMISGGGGGKEGGVEVAEGV